MKKERITCLNSSLINLLVIILKIIGGMFFHCYSLIASGYLTMIHLFEDLIALLFAKLENRRANKRYPFGLGKVEYVFQMVMGFVIVLLGCYIIIKSFFHEHQAINLNLIYIFTLILLLIILNASYLTSVGKKIRSQLLTTNASITYKDLIATGVIVLVGLASYFYSLMDLFGSIYIAILIIFEGIEIILTSIFIIYGKDINSVKMKKEIAKVVNENANIVFSDTEILVFNDLYQLNIELASSSYNIHEIVTLEKNIKNALRKKNYKIILIDFIIINK